MKQLLYFGAICVCMCFFSCHHVNKDLVLHPDEEVVRMGAIYISCEAPPWKLSIDGIMSCEFNEVAPLQLNPANACALQHIADENGSLSINFSSEPTRGRIVVEKLNNNVELKDKNNEPVNKLYTNQSDHFFLENDDVRLRLTVKNAYIGGCYHELIQWQTVQ